MSWCEGLPALMEFDSTVTTAGSLVRELRARAEEIKRSVSGAPLLDMHANFSLGKAEAYREIAHTLERLMQLHGEP